MKTYAAAFWVCVISYVCDPPGDKRKRNKLLYANYAHAHRRATRAILFIDPLTVHTQTSSPVPKQWKRENGPATASHTKIIITSCAFLRFDSDCFTRPRQPTHSNEYGAFGCRKRIRTREGLLLFIFVAVVVCSSL